MDERVRRVLANGAYLVVVAVGLLALSSYNYLLYHTTVEVFSTVVAAAVLIVAWNGRRLLDNDYLLLVGFAYLSFSIIDLVHMLSFPEIGVFKGYGPELTIQLYVVQRLILAASFMIAPYFLTHRLRQYLWLFVYLAVTAAAIATVFLTGIDSALGLGGAGMPGRLVFDGLTVAMFAASTAAVWVNRRYFDEDVMWLLIATTVSLTVSQVVFALGSQPGPRFVAHYAQGLALFLTYKAVVETAFVRPGALLYRDLADRELAERTSSQRYQEVADTLQTALLKVPERLEGVSIVSRYRSSSDVAKIGGDFYDVFEIDNRLVGFTLGDVSGKGLEAATTTAEVKSTIRAYAYLRADPSFVLERANDVMYRLLSESQFVTALFGVLDTVTGELEMASAGHEEPVICIRRECDFLSAPANLPLGVGYGVQYRTARTKLFLGDGLLAYTDGVPDARRGDERFGRERLRGLVEAGRERSPAALADDVLAAVMRFSEGILADDVAVLGLELTRPDPEAAAREEERLRSAEPVVAGALGQQGD